MNTNVERERRERVLKQHIHREREKEKEKEKLERERDQRRNCRLVFLLYMVSKAESKIDTLLEKRAKEARRERE